MPELPEVETIKLGLERKIVGLTIKNIEVLNPKSVHFNPQQIKNSKIIKIWRRAKMLGMDLEGTQNLVLLFHLKMTGQLVLETGENRVTGGHPTQDIGKQMPNKSTRAIFTFNNGDKLYFNDQRKFGWIKLIESTKLPDQSELKNLGPDPLEKSFTWEVLKDRFSKHQKLPVKLALMNQQIVSGIGNIYASEALFKAKIDPKRLVSALENQDYQKLYQGIIKALRISLKYGGTTLRNYVDVEGQKGKFLDFAEVYGRAGQSCKVCQREISKITQAGRGTYFCPACQK